MSDLEGLPGRIDENLATEDPEERLVAGADLIRSEFEKIARTMDPMQRLRDAVFQVDLNGIGHIFKEETPYERERGDSNARILEHHGKPANATDHLSDKVIRLCVGENYDWAEEPAIIHLVYVIKERTVKILDITELTIDPFWWQFSENSTTMFGYGADMPVPWHSPESVEKIYTQLKSSLFIDGDKNRPLIGAEFPPVAYSQLAAIRVKVCLEED